MMFRSTKMLVLLAIVAGLALCVLPAMATNWNAYSDFSTASATGTPWSYGFANAASVPDTYTVAAPGYSDPFWHDGTPGFRWFLDSTSTNGCGDHDRAPCIGVYTGAGFWVFSNPGLYIWPAPNLSGNRVVTLRWTAPNAGTYSYSGSIKTVNSQACFWIVKCSAAGTHTTVRPLDTLTSSATDLAGSVTMDANDKFDILVDGINSWERPIVKLDLTMSNLETPGIKGWVKDAAGLPVDGATVSNGTQSTTTTFDGTYSMVISTPGTYTITATKAGSTIESYSGVVIGTSGMVTENFTLHAGNTISGTVTSNSGGVPLGGVNVISSDGVYSTNTNAAGFYSLVVTPGAYDIQFSKNAFAPKTVNVSAASGNATCNVGLNIAWDAANDFGTGSNPSGAWEMGNLDASGAYSVCTKVGDLYDARVFNWCRDWAAFGSTATKNLTVLPFTLNDSLSNPYIEGGKLILMAGMPESAIAAFGSWATGHFWDNNTAVAKFISPANGPFTVTARFGAASTTADAYIPVALRYKPAGGSTYTYWLGKSTSPRDPNMTFVDGFQGKAVNSYTDSVGTTPVVTYSNTLTLHVGDVVEALVGFNAQTITDSAGVLNVGWTKNLGRWVQTDLNITIPANYSTITGTVNTANLAGNPPVAGVTVTATSGGQSYSGVTDATGVYFLSLPAGAYTLTATNAAYATGTASTSVAAGATLVVNFSLNGNFANSVKDIKSFADGAGVVVITPLQLACGTKALWNEVVSFDKKFGAYTTVTDSSGTRVTTTVPEYSFYVQSDDRVSGIKCIIPNALYAGITPHGPDYKITFTGVISTDANGTRYVTISSIDSAVQNTNAVVPTPLGKTSKGLSKSGTLVKVWGKVTQHVANPIANSPAEQLNGLPGWDYEYIVINDGGQDVKIPLHVQDHMFPVSYMGTLDVGDYIAVIGIAGTTNGTDLAVFPLRHTDIVDYTFNKY